VAATGLLTACGGDSGTPTLTWYINPDPNPPDGFKGPFGQAGIADRCSTDKYTIKTELLPQSATEQRIQLLRRLVAKDSSISLMSLDPVFTGEFAEAGFLEPLPDALASELRGATPSGTASWWRPRCGPTPRPCGTASRWRRRPAWT
jgi:multiple sugar transport system substrate-binding protein